MDMDKTAIDAAAKAAYDRAYKSWGRVAWGRIGERAQCEAIAYQIFMICIAPGSEVSSETMRKIFARALVVAIGNAT